MNLRKVILPLILSLSFLFGACQESTQTPESEGSESPVSDESEDAGEAIEDAGDSLEDATN
ncbi:hypothetical protein [Pleurocapsa sp. PCC 7319]|uniref:hypothetical protein n=1 Tax=Pleurocapsa sp. PCC 7319 TaxID=118161 RepID=UPI00034BE3D5|nr:hypothetical protein [Pleurocapsa sp. PCC 7319]